jgi:hypothetical protein
MAAVEDQSALLAWYANHLKGGDDASSSPPPAPAVILEEAEAAVLQAAALTMESAVDTLETTA